MSHLVHMHLAHWWLGTGVFWGCVPLPWSKECLDLLCAQACIGKMKRRCHVCLSYLNMHFLLGKHKLESSGLPRGCLLYKTLQAQMLDMLDIEGLHPLYSRVEQYLEEFPEER